MVEMNGMKGVQDEVPEYVRGEIASVLISAEKIRERIEALGREIAEDCKGKDPLLLGILTGSFVFLSDLCREIECKHEIAFLRAKSYVGTESTGKVKLEGLESIDISGRHVIIVEDIVDTGNTLEKLLPILFEKKPASVEICTLLLKETERRTKDLSVKYTAFTIPDQFVVGYGLDYDQSMRHLPFIGIFKP
ncbi:hypothetical protein NDN08_002583 [Rhodosorus marinus]|uniref:Hypoxanthine phosphoribosyltransferase n=1 Tax=Rhodosorus marinus TaxID=101924 RepID=A0AAV8UVK8_9RHOD|nr:hypothetical protein NDN08_002583 [Rhodosorus marinus]